MCCWQWLLSHTHPLSWQCLDENQPQGGLAHRMQSGAAPDEHQKTQGIAEKPVAGTDRVDTQVGLHPPCQPCGPRSHSFGGTALQVGGAAAPSVPLCYWCRHLKAGGKHTPPGLPSDEQPPTDAEAQELMQEHERVCAASSMHFIPNQCSLNFAHLSSGHCTQ